MAPRRALLPREGLTADPIFKLFARTALNPALLLPLVLLARYTKQGGRLTILHPTAFRRLRVLLYCGLAHWLTRWLSSRVLNNWTNDTYTWSREVVLVTGGAGGIGGHIARLFAERGVTVAVLDIQPSLTFAASSHIHYFQCDITSPENVAAAAREIREKVGNPTVLINNAGVARGKTILGTTEHDIRFTFDVNTLAHFWTAREFLPSMVAANHGMVVTVASLAAYLAVPDLVDYSASKAAALAFHEGLTAELATRYAAPRVRTVLVTQGYAKTPLFRGWQPDGRFLMPALEPETVAEAVVDQVLSGTSGQVVVPGVAGTLASALRALPHWYQLRVREKGQSFMAGFSGRQVVEDPEAFYAEKEKAEHEV